VPGLACRKPATWKVPQNSEKILQDPVYFLPRSRIDFLMTITFFKILFGGKKPLKCRLGAGFKKNLY
jgi:hypothetical protein